MPTVIRFWRATNAKSVPSFQQEPLQFPENPGFEVALAIEIEQVRVTENELGRKPVGLVKTLEAAIKHIDEAKPISPADKKDPPKKDPPPKMQ